MQTVKWGKMINHQSIFFKPCKFSELFGEFFNTVKFQTTWKTSLLIFFVQGFFQCLEKG